MNVLSFTRQGRVQFFMIYPNLYFREGRRRFARFFRFSGSAGRGGFRMPDLAAAPPGLEGWGAGVGNRFPMGGCRQEAAVWERGGERRSGERRSGEGRFGKRRSGEGYICGAGGEI